MYGERIAGTPPDNLHRLHSLIGHLLGLLGLLLAVLQVFAGPPVGSDEVLLLLGLWFLSQTGVVVGFHRCFSHRSFKTTPPVRATLAILGSTAALGHPVFWVALHRQHHRFSDRPGDPHSPHVSGDGPLGTLRGFWHAHVGWSTSFDMPDFQRYAPDLLADPLMRRICEWYPLWVVLGLALPAAIGALLAGSWAGAFHGLVWGGLLRLWLTHQATLSITSVSHLFGHREHDSGDRSTNNGLLALPTLGDSWHNNHHACPRAAVVGWKWWQLDIAGLLIRALEKLGLAWDVKQPPPALLASSRRGS